jgi:3'(2'), 5'-bisphosphate nucleotidase
MGKVVWFTGLSGSGKTTLALGVEKQLSGNVKVLDADEIRATLHTNLGFSREDIRLNNQLVAELAKKNAVDYDFVLVPIISPYSEDRAMVRNIVGADFLELFVDASLQEVQRRDVKGLYAKAASGEINNMIGVAQSNPYQPPSTPDIHVKTDGQTEVESVNLVVNHLEQKPSFSEEVGVAIAAALKAGKRVLQYYTENNFTTNHKEDESPITCADLESNRILMEELGKTGISILSEEEKDFSGRISQSKIWIIDPIDGTSDFVHHTDEFTIMIALIENNQPKLGVIFGPVFDVLYAWEKGRGAYKYKEGLWKKLSVNSLNSIPEVKVLCSRNNLTDAEKVFFEFLKPQLVTPRGSSFKAAGIASGKAELYLTFTGRIKQWDTAAYYGLVYEAGGKVTDLEGNAFVYNTEDICHANGILITNGVIHDKIVEKIKEFRKLP